MIFMPSRCMTHVSVAVHGCALCDGCVGPWCRQEGRSARVVAGGLRPDGCPEVGGSVKPLVEQAVVVYRSGAGNIGHGESPGTHWVGSGGVPIAPQESLGYGAVAWLGAERGGGTDSQGNRARRLAGVVVVVVQEHHYSQ